MSPAPASTRLPGRRPRLRTTNATPTRPARGGFPPARAASEEGARAPFEPTGVPPAAGTAVVVYWIPGPLPGPTRAAAAGRAHRAGGLPAHGWHDLTAAARDVNPAGSPAGRGPGGTVEPCATAIRFRQLNRAARPARAGARRADSSSTGGRPDDRQPGNRGFRSPDRRALARGGVLPAAAGLRRPGQRQRPRHLRPLHRGQVPRVLHRV